MVRIAVFASGGGSNLQSLLDHFNANASPIAAVVMVVSDRADAGALGRARVAGVDARVIVVDGRTTDAIASETLAALEHAKADMIVLAGYMKLVPGSVVRRYRGRMLNIHPALLPAFGGKGMYGMRVHRAVIEAGCRVTGITVHFVDERYDEGRPIVQWPVPVLRGDSAETLAARVLRTEHVVYPLAVEAVARGAVGMKGFRGEESAAFAWAEHGNVAAAAIRRILDIDSQGAL
jgi:formyltetrahydrofolate-dependent phosphoribosylglycinamide formyltransferase